MRTYTWLTARVLAIKAASPSQRRGTQQKLTEEELLPGPLCSDPVEAKAYRNTYCGPQKGAQPKLRLSERNEVGNCDSQHQNHPHRWAKPVISALPSVIRALHLLLGVSVGLRQPHKGLAGAKPKEVAPHVTA